MLEELQVSAQRFLSAEKTGKVKGLILTLKGDSSGKHKGHDFYSRYFAPWYGILEDPVTGVCAINDSCFGSVKRFLLNFMNLVLYFRVFLTNYCFIWTAGVFSLN